MTSCKALFIPLLLIFSLCISLSAVADTQQATCEFTKEGDRVNNASGECSISEDQGKITIVLKNGNKFKLKPRKKADQYIDKDDNEVKRRSESEQTTQYKWENKNIRVTIDEADTSKPDSSSTGSNHGPNNAGKKVVGLQDLVGKVSNSGESELKSRGYKMKNSFASGGSIYANWKNQSSGECISVRTQDDSVRSVFYSSEQACKQ